MKVNNEVIRADRTAERTVGRIKNVFTTRFSVYFLTSCNFKSGVLGTNYHTTIMVDGRDCVASTVDVSNPAYFKRCLDSAA